MIFQLWQYCIEYVFICLCLNVADDQGADLDHILTSGGPGAEQRAEREQQCRERLESGGGPQPVQVPRQ